MRSHSLWIACGVPLLLSSCEGSSVTVTTGVDVPMDVGAVDTFVGDREDAAGATLDAATDGGLDADIGDARGLDADAWDGSFPADLGAGVEEVGTDLGLADVDHGEGGCGDGRMRCGETCVDLHSDSAHCGACETRCCPGLVCSYGECQSACGAGLSVCGSDPTCRGGACRDLRTDYANCGACGHACCAGTVCSGGRCFFSCPVGLTTCGEACEGGGCFGLGSNPTHCGACGNACRAGTHCVVGTCTPTTLDAGGGDVGDG